MDAFLHGGQFADRQRLNFRAPADAMTFTWIRISGGP